MRKPAKTDRYKTIQLLVRGKPAPGYEYVVTGRGEFPVDMMRYDQAWPLDPILSSDRRRSITMRGLAEPTIGRWASFGWSVGFEADTREEN